MLMQAFVSTIIREDIARIVSASLPWKNFSGATVLVTGASGFLPAYMVETLSYLNKEVLSEPCKIVALVRDIERAEERFKGYPDVEIWQGDVLCPPNIPVNYILHAASQASPKFYKTDPVGTLAPNVLGTARLLDLARRQKDFRGFLFFSSGEAALHLDPLDIRSCYGESKRMGETMCMAWFRQFGIPVRIVRISHTYGPGMKLDDGRIFADFTRDILRGGPITLHSDGTARRPFLYLADATLAFFTVLLKGKEEAYNVAHPDDISVRELADMLAEIFDLTVERVHRLDTTYVPATIQGTNPDISKTEALGWSPVTGIKEGFIRTVKSYR